MNTAVHKDGVWKEVKLREEIAKHGSLFQESVPVRLGNKISCFMAMDCGKIKGAIDLCVHMCEIEPLPEKHTLALWDMSLEGIRWRNEVYCLGRSRSANDWSWYHYDVKHRFPQRRGVISPSYGTAIGLEDSFFVFSLERKTRKEVFAIS